MGFEESIIRNAAPTLAGIKVANLYNYHFKNKSESVNFIGQINGQLNKKGIYVELMKNCGDFYLLYVYRKSQLQKEIEKPEIRQFLGEYGYTYDDCLQCLNMLRKRIETSECFPHEIGVFLGYPIKDVKAFIEKKGKEAVMCGEWKVYYDVQEAMCFFCKLKKCKEVYAKVYHTGRSIYDMTVSA
jgi:hypothetical protein